MKKILMEYCRGIGLEYVGIAPPGPYNELEKLLQSRIDKGYYTGFEESDIRKRVNPSLTLEGVKSIIVCLFPYYAGQVGKSNISKYAHGVDYHIIAREKLEDIAKYLSGKIANFNYKIFVDSGPLVDRYIAYLAGLGFYGINNLLINERYGSYVSIGYIMCNFPFEPDKPLEKSCAGCSECIKKCPGGAILGEYEINPVKCLSYITQKKGELTDEEIETLKKGNMVFGCDMCQEVCPHNRQIELTDIPEFKSYLINNLEYKKLSEMSNKEFKRKYGARAFSWRGRNIILRNFDLIKDNQNK